MKEKYVWELSDLIIPVMAGALAVYYLTTVWGMPFMALMYGGGLSIIVLLLVFWTVILVARDVILKKSTDATTLKEKLQRYRKAAIMVGFMALYIYILPRVGYTISSFLLICVVTYFLGCRDKLFIIRNATLITMLGFFLFVLFLRVPLPLDSVSMAVRRMVMEMLL